MLFAAKVHSRRVANEWVERLRELIVYWKQRHRVNAKDEIDLAQARQPRVTPQIRVCDEHEVPPEYPDLSAPYPALDTLFNWCIIDGCRPISKEGKLYMRKGLRGQFKCVYFIWCPSTRLIEILGSYKYTWWMDI